MAGDDHPDKKMVAAGDIKGKRKAISEKIQKQSTSDEEISDKIPKGVETGGSNAAISVEGPPVKKLKIDNADQSAKPSPSSPSPQTVPVAAPLRVPCPLCQRVFDSYPAMFGHQRVHKERTYRGAYPPPTFKREGSLHPPQLTVDETEEATRQAAQMLIEMSKGRFEKPTTVISTTEAEEDGNGMNLNLNISVEVEKSSEEEEAAEAEEAAKRENEQLDLNKSPPSGSE